jgi:hypothetical protein
MTRLSKTETYAILWLTSQNQLPEDIAKQLSLDIKQVTKVVEKNYKTNDGPSAIKTVSESAAKKSKSKNLMITHTRDKKTNNVSIMTKEASSLNDELKKNFTTKRFNENTIFRPNGK